jgi:hypothetical protein
VFCLHFGKPANDVVQVGIRELVRMTNEIAPLLDYG